MIQSNKNKEKIIILFTIILMISNSNTSLIGDEYLKIADDSVRIINPMMLYHLDLLKNKHKFEDITFKNYDTNSFKSLYDSLCNLYIPLKKYYAGQSLWDYNIGLNVAFLFLIDSNTFYTLWIFIPDSIYDSRSYFKSNLMTKLYKLKNFGIVAFKDSTHIKDLNEIYKNDNQSINENYFYLEYKKLLKKLNKKKKKKKIP